MAMRRRLSRRLSFVDLDLNEDIAFVDESRGELRSRVIARL